MMTLHQCYHSLSRVFYLFGLFMVFPFCDFNVQEEPKEESDDDMGFSLFD